MMTDEEIAAVAGLALMWFDTDAAFGPDDARTVAVLERMREQIGQCRGEPHKVVDIEPQRPTFTVIPGDLE